MITPRWSCSRGSPSGSHADTDCSVSCHWVGQGSCPKAERFCCGDHRRWAKMPSVGQSHLPSCRDAKAASCSHGPETQLCPSTAGRQQAPILGTQPRHSKEASVPPLHERSHQCAAAGPPRCWRADVVPGWSWPRGEHSDTGSPFQCSPLSSCSPGRCQSKAIAMCSANGMAAARPQLCRAGPSVCLPAWMSGRWGGGTQEPPAPLPPSL